ncbi:MAG: HAMP domain-containing histidine kinase [Candidatus Marinimicrobia bacterium]|nr:HAMP domain-containing histidine kinase [Candidatus Neomarinimicrobiota bacterium]MBL7023453.1 HAMP domain-containing histidine kinase [Candidatus Neomarinimicrobiota bacterium]MBL7109292.1 HAMP domain-containing histidine kinase [Candidatus Neomarinimicrobiota bacterium]
MISSKSFKIKLGIFLTGVLIILGVFWLNQSMIVELRQGSNQQAEYFAKIYAEAINKPDAEDIKYVMDILLPSMNFPIIVTTADEISAWKNLDIKVDEKSPNFKFTIKKIIEKLDSEFTPLPIIWNDIKIGEIHYGDPAMVGKLAWLPYLEIGFAIVFLFLTFLGFQVLRRSEKNFIWAGMARETAHQLGTPVSSLMGWIKLLEDDEMDKEMILKSMNQDVNRLSRISDRFHKIGSSPKLMEFNLTDMSKDVVDYMKTRLPSSSNTQITVSGDEAIISGEKVLLSWALENMVKNSIDACDSASGKIEVFISSLDVITVIDVVDNGKGIELKNRNNIFRPGYSTKKRGWGLGLSLSRRIIEEIHGGKIRVIKSKLGETVIRIELRR